MSIKSLFEDIADAIREKSGSSDTYTPAEMPDAIRNISGKPAINNFQLTVIGGYNGDAPIILNINDTEVFIAIGNSPYNLTYKPPSGIIDSFRGDPINISITPPAGQSSSNFLNVKLSGGIVFDSGKIYPLGSNQSYGYNYDSGIIYLE